MPLLTSLSATLKGSGWDEEEVENWLSDAEAVCNEDDVAPQGQYVSFEGDYVTLQLSRGWRPEAALPGQLADPVFDFLELYAGCKRMSAAWARKGFSVLPPVEFKDGLDLRDGELFFGLMRLIRRGGVRFLWWAPPCTTFSLARTPKLRSLQLPWGYDILDLVTLLGNLHASQMLLLALLQICVGHAFAGEQPGFGFMRALPPWQKLIQLGALEVLFDWCRYKQPFRKITRIITNVPALRQLGLRCNHRHKHRTLKGSATTQASAYSVAFCDKVASLCAAAWKGCGGPGLEVSTGFGDGVGGEVGCAASAAGGGCMPSCGGDAHDRRERRERAARKRSSALWAVQLSESLRWSTYMQYRFRMVKHINLQEAKARRSLVKRLHRDKRVVIAQDSRVNLGALGKGRSPSRALNSLMRSEAPYLLGKNLYVSGLHLPTWSIRADAPSRFTVPEGPRVKVPSWFWKLRAGDFRAAQELDEAEGLSRACNRWFLLAGYVLLRASGQNCPSSSSTRTPSRIVGAWSNHRSDSTHPGGSGGRLAGVAESSRTRLQLGGAGSFSHRCFIGMVRGIYDFHVLGRAESQSSGRDPQCNRTALWLGSVLSCRALESHSHLGHLRASATPSSNASTSTACSCGYCLGLAVASFGGDYGVGLFWFTETLRAYWVATTGRCSAQRQLRSQSLVPQSGTAQDPPSRSSQSARSRRRGLGCRLGRPDAHINASVEASLEWLMEFLQDSL